MVLLNNHLIIFISTLFIGHKTEETHNNFWPTFVSHYYSTFLKYFHKNIKLVCFFHFKIVMKVVFYFNNFFLLMYSPCLHFKTTIALQLVMQNLFQQQLKKNLMRKQKYHVKKIPNIHLLKNYPLFHKKTATFTNIHSIHICCSIHWLAPRIYTQNAHSQHWQDKIPRLVNPEQLWRQLHNCS